MTSPYDVLSRIRSNRPPPETTGERCEMCAESIADEHQHVVNVGARQLMCVCRACYLLFTDSEAELRYRAVPDRYLKFGDFALDRRAWEVLTARVGVETGGDDPVHAIALRCQVRIEPLRRSYSDEEAAGLMDLFGSRERWASTQRTFLWQHCTAMVPGFAGNTTVALPLDCTYDFEVAAAKYLHALRHDTLPLQFLFSGTIFVKSQRGFYVQQVPWDCEYRYDMPVAVWRDLMAQHYPNSGWVRLSHETIAALAAYKSARGMLDLEHAVTSLLDIEREAAQ